VTVASSFGAGVPQSVGVERRRHGRIGSMSNEARDTTKGGLDRRTLLTTSAAIGLAAATGLGSEPASVAAWSQSEQATPSAQMSSGAGSSYVKLFLTQVKRADLTEQQFHDYWRHPRDRHRRPAALRPEPPDRYAKPGRNAEALRRDH